MIKIEIAGVLGPIWIDADSEHELDDAAVIELVMEDVHTYLEDHACWRVTRDDGEPSAWYRIQHILLPSGCGVWKVAPASEGE